MLSTQEDEIIDVRSSLEEDYLPESSSEPVESADCVTSKNKF